MLKSGLYGYSGAHILLSGTITVPNTGTETSPNNRKNILTKNCAPFTDCIRELNNTQINSSKDIDKVMQMYNLIEYSRNYSKRSESLQQYYRDEPFLDANADILDFPTDNNNSASFKSKTKIIGRVGNDREKDVKFMVLLKHFWRTLEKLLIDCGINLMVTSSANCFIIDAPIENQAQAFTISDGKFYVSIVT